MARHLTVLLSVVVLAIGVNFPIAYSVNQPEGFSKKQKKQIKIVVKKWLSVNTRKPNGHKTVRFEAVNVQIRNGLSNTATVNGTGNLIIGYDERSKLEKRGLTISWSGLVMDTRHSAGWYSAGRT